jgi:hypothetical protein
MLLVHMIGGQHAGASWSALVSVINEKIDLKDEPL